MGASLIRTWISFIVAFYTTRLRYSTVERQSGGARFSILHHIIIDWHVIFFSSTSVLFWTVGISASDRLDGSGQICVATWLLYLGDFVCSADGVYMMVLDCTKQSE